MRPEEIQLLYTIIGSLLIGAILMSGFIFSMIHQYRFALTLKRQNEEGRIEAQEQERRLIAADLHDDLGQRLVYVKLKMQSAEPKTEKSAAALQEASEHIQTVIADLKSTSLKLAPTGLKFEGPLYAIENFASKFLGGQPVKVEVERVPLERLTEEQALHIYRMLQEMLQNVVKHSRATKMRIYAEEFDDSIIVHAKDNGTGFVNDGGSGGAGLENLQMRARIIGARLVTESSANGTHHSIIIPLK